MFDWKSSITPYHEAGFARVIRIVISKWFYTNSWNIILTKYAWVSHVHPCFNLLVSYVILNLLFPNLICRIKSICLSIIIYYLFNRKILRCNLSFYSQHVYVIALASELKCVTYIVNACKLTRGSSVQRLLSELAIFYAYNLLSLKG
jgi:hypothetical protein